MYPELLPIRGAMGALCCRGRLRFEFSASEAHWPAADSDNSEARDQKARVANDAGIVLGAWSCIFEGWGVLFLKLGFSPRRARLPCWGGRRVSPAREQRF